MVRRVSGAIIAVIGGAGLLLATMAVVMEMQALSLADAVSRFEATPQEDLRRTRLDALVADVDDSGPFGGGTPGYWDTAALAYLHAINDRVARGEDWSDLAAKAERAAQASLARRPLHHGPWSRLAALDLARDGVLDAPGRRALAMARRSAPYRSAMALWRAEFALSIWAQLDGSAREAALTDAAHVLTAGQYPDQRRLEDIVSAAPADVREAVAMRVAAIDAPPKEISTDDQAT